MLNESNTQCLGSVVPLAMDCICVCLLKDVQALIPTKCCPSCLSFKGWSLHREATQSKRHPPISEILCVRLFLNISILIYIPLVISMYSELCASSSEKEHLQSFEGAIFSTAGALSVRAVIWVSVHPSNPLYILFFALKPIKL